VSQRNRRVQIALTQQEWEALQLWKKTLDMGDGELLGGVCLKWKKGLLFITDENTLHALYGQWEDRIIRLARRIGQEAVMKELYRQGFNVTPSDK